jgi:Fe-S-cluster-containing hydrogenase component 2
MKVHRKIIEIDEELCDGCGQCVPSCAEGALQIVDGKARVLSDNLCDGLGACLGECPAGAMKIIEREAEEFDEAAVEKHLEECREEEKKPFVHGGGCPSATVQFFASSQDVSKKADVGEIDDSGSALTHWPIQIRLVPPHAPFLKNADLLVLADCAAVAYARLHPDLLQGRVIMMGCPKFDDAEEYLERFEAIFRQAGIRSVLNVFMEVPCCSALPMIVKKALSASGKSIPVEDLVITTRGGIQKEAEKVHKAL